MILTKETLGLFCQFRPPEIMNSQIFKKFDSFHMTICAVHKIFYDMNVVNFMRS